jgi:hypothetical protein
MPEAALAFLRETDPLRLTVTTMAFVERALVDALERILPTESGKAWAHHLPMERKLDLALGAGVIPPAAATGLQALQKLRNEYAHSPDPPDLTAEKADQVRRAWRELYPPLVQEPAEPEPPEDFPGDRWQQLMALMEEPRERRRLRQACYAAAFVAEWARTRADEITEDRDVDMRNRALRLYAEQRLEGLLPQVAPNEPDPGAGTEG